LRLKAMQFFGAELMKPFIRYQLYRFMRKHKLGIYRTYNPKD
jgi:Sec-independent protein secretion pathway component TatC